MSIRLYFLASFHTLNSTFRAIYRVESLYFDIMFYEIKQSIFWRAFYERTR